MKGFEKPFDEMGKDELSNAYIHMTRNCSVEQKHVIEGSGPLSDNEFIRQRQEVYRTLIAKSEGVIFASAPGEIMHHPV